MLFHQNITGSMHYLLPYSSKYSRLSQLKKKPFDFYVALRNVVIIITRIFPLVLSDITHRDSRVIYCGRMNRQF